MKNLLTINQTCELLQIERYKLLKDTRNGLFKRYPINDKSFGYKIEDIRNYLLNK